MSRHNSPSKFAVRVALIFAVAIAMIIPSLNVASASSSSVRQSQPKFSGNGSLQQYGTSVALSRDGKLAVVGAPSAFNGVGFVYTYQKQEGNNDWIPLGSNETALEPLDAVGQGTSLALTADGSVLVVGAPEDGNTQGLVRIYSRNIENNDSETTTTWILQHTLENPSNQLDVGGFGTSLAITDDGLTLVVGANGGFGCQGGAFVFTRSSIQNEFRRFGPKLVGTNSQGSSNQGYSTAISSGNGQFVALGGPDDAFGSGAVWVFSRESDRFNQMGRKLTVGFDSDNFGFAVEYSNEGRILLVGAPFRFPRGAVFMYRLNNDGTSYQQVQQLSAVASCSTNSMFGFSVALSQAGTRVAIGAPFHTPGSSGGAGLIGTTFVLERQGDDRFVLSQNLSGSVADDNSPSPTKIQDLEMNQETRAINQGFSVAIASNTSNTPNTVVVLIGAPEEGFNSEGSVRFFESDLSSNRGGGQRRGLLQRQFGYRNLLSNDRQELTSESTKTDHDNVAAMLSSRQSRQELGKGRLKIVTKVIRNVTSKLKKQPTRN